MKRQCSRWDYFLLDLCDSLENLIRPYTHRIIERQKMMQKAEEKRTAPYQYLQMLKKISPHNPDDWRAGDVCFLEHYKKDKELYEKLLQIRKDYFGLGNGEERVS